MGPARKSRPRPSNQGRNSPRCHRGHRQGLRIGWLRKSTLPTRNHALPPPDRPPNRSIQTRGPPTATATSCPQQHPFMDLPHIMGIYGAPRSGNRRTLPDRVLLPPPSRRIHHKPHQTDHSDTTIPTTRCGVLPPARTTIIHHPPSKSTVTGPSPTTNRQPKKWAPRANHRTPRHPQPMLPRKSALSPHHNTPKGWSNPRHTHLRLPQPT